MIDVMSVKNKTMLLSNLSFDHPLFSNEINDLINLLSSGVRIGQIYFKDDIDMDSIEKVKLLLEGLPNIEDEKIEKYIMKSITEDEKKQLDRMTFQNIDTWNIAYSIENNRFSVTSLSKYRLIDEWFDNTIKNMPDNLSQLEKICFIYDKVKLFEFDDNVKYGRLPEIISSGSANSYGYNLIFKELLSMCKVPSIIESYEIDGEKNFITIAEIDDTKYNVNGIYLFDASMDTISKDQYRHGLARRMNYNFFSITTNKLANLNGQVIPHGLLKSLMSNDELEYKHYLNRYNRKYGDVGITQMKSVFKSDMDDIFFKTSSSKEIPDEIIFEIFSNRVDSFTRKKEERETIKKTLISNYMDREDELFSFKSVKQLSKKEIVGA